MVDEPRTYREVAQSAYSKQWEEALGRQLGDTGVMVTGVRGQKNKEQSYVSGRVLSH